MGDSDDLDDFVSTPRDGADDPGPEMVWLQDSSEGLEAFAPSRPAADSATAAVPHAPLPPPGEAAPGAEPVADAHPHVFRVADDRAWLTKAAWSGVLCLALAAAVDQMLNFDLDTLPARAQRPLVATAPPVPAPEGEPVAPAPSVRVSPGDGPVSTEPAAADVTSLDARLRAAIAAPPPRPRLDVAAIEREAIARAVDETPVRTVAPPPAVPPVVARTRPAPGPEVAESSTAATVLPASESVPARTETPPLATTVHDPQVVLPPAQPPAATAVAALPPPSAAPPAAPVVTPRDRDTQAVQRVLGQYRHAFNTLDADAAQAIWPSVNEKTLARAFDRLADQAVSFDDCAIEVGAAAAEAACRGIARYVPKIGNRSPKAESREWRFSLRRAGTGWLIDRVDAR